MSIKLSSAHLEEITQEIEKQSRKLSPASIKIFNERIKIIKEHLDRLSNNHQKMDRIVKKISSKVKKDPPDFLLTDINKLVDSIFKNVTETKQFDNNNCCLNLETDYDLAIGEKRIILEDLESIANNLIDNACDAVFEKKKKEVGFEGKIKIFTKLINRQLIELIVQDNGEGIPPKIAKSIYNPFGSTKRPGGGMGLGLFITYDLVKKNGGRIRWERKTGLTRFIVTFRVLPRKN